MAKHCNKRAYRQRQFKRALGEEHAAYFKGKSLKDWYKHPERFDDVN